MCDEEFNQGLEENYQDVAYYLRLFILHNIKNITIQNFAKHIN